MNHCPGCKRVKDVIWSKEIPLGCLVGCDECEGVIFYDESLKGLTI